MTSTLEALKDTGILQPRSAAARLRRRMTVLSTAGVGTALLVLAAFAELRDSAPYLNGGTPQAPGGLAPIVAQPQNRVGTAVAVTLLTIPVIAIVVQALQVGRLERDRTYSRLSLAGATPQELRHLAARDTATAFACGGWYAGPTYLVLWILLGALLPAGSRLLPAPDTRLVATWLFLVVLMAAAGAAVGGRRRHHVDPLGGVASPRRRVHPLWAAVSGPAALYLLVHVPDYRLVGIELLPVAIVVETILILFTAATLVTAWVGRARRNPLRSDQAVEVLAAAQRRGHPAGAGWVAAVLFVCGLALHLGLAQLVYFLSTRDKSSNLMFYVGPTLLAMAAVLVAAGVALATLALAMTDHLLTARRAVASTAAVGIEPRRLVAVQARVLSAVSVPAIVSGYLAPALIYVFFDPSPTLILILITAPLLGTTIKNSCHLVAQRFDARLTAATALTHLRTP